MKKYKVISKKPFITDEEIDAFRDFDEVLNTGQAKIDLQKRYGYVAKAALFIAAVVLVMFFANKYMTAPPVENKNLIPTDSTNTVSKEKPLEQVEEAYDSAAEVADAIEMEEEVVGKENHIEPEKSRQQEEPIVQKMDSGGSAVEPKYEYLEAEPVAGLEALYRYFDEELHYPEEAIADSVSGISLVSFVINVEGEPEQIKVITSLGPLFDAEAIRVIENMPPWRPATINDRPINSKVSIPLMFQINEK